MRQGKRLGDGEYLRRLPALRFPGPGRAARGRRDFPGPAGTLDTRGGGAGRVTPAEGRSESQTGSRLPGGGPPAALLGSGPDSRAPRVGINDREQ